jgi:hypothetical protein
MFLATREMHDRKLVVWCKEDADGAIAEISDANDEVVANLVVSYDQKRPSKRMQVSVKPHDSITNPRIEVLWDQMQRCVSTSSQGRTVEMYFRHDPDLITRSLTEFAADVKWFGPGMGMSRNYRETWLVLNAMRKSVERGGGCVDVVV